MAADLIRTLAVQPTIASIGVLGLIVVIRTLLGFSLDVEIDGVLPWRKRVEQTRFLDGDRGGARSGRLVANHNSRSRVWVDGAIDSAGRRRESSRETRTKE